MTDGNYCAMDPVPGQSESVLLNDVLDSVSCGTSNVSRNYVQHQTGLLVANIHLVSTLNE